MVPSMEFGLPKEYQDKGGIGAGDRLPHIYFRQQPKFDGPIEIFKDRHNISLKDPKEMAY